MLVTKTETSRWRAGGGDGAGRIISIFYTQRKKSAQRLRLIHDQAANKKLKINDK